MGFLYGIRGMFGAGLNEGGVQRLPLSLVLGNTLARQMITRSTAEIARPIKYFKVVFCRVCG